MKILLALALVKMISAWSCNDPSASAVLSMRRLGKISDQAVCNDGTEAAYYYAPATHQNNTWVVYLAGGGQCYDQDSCQGRWNGTSYPHHNCDESSEDSPCFMSSKDFPKECGKTGIFDTDASLNPVAGAHKIYVPYCSSDAHIGNATFSTWQMQGKQIVQSVLQDLLQNLGMGAAGQLIIFGGGSAGGRGSLVLLDSVRAMIPSSSNVLGFLDSPYYIDLKPYNSDFIGFPGQTVKFNENFKSNLYGECAQAFPDELYKCLLGQYRAPFVKTSYLIIASQFDTWQLSHDVQNYDGMFKNPNYTDD